MAVDKFGKPSLFLASASSVVATPEPSRSRRVDPQLKTARLSRAAAQGFESDSLDERPELTDRERQYIRILRQERDLMRLRIQAINEVIEANQEAEREIMKVEWGSEDLEPDE